MFGGAFSGFFSGWDTLSAYTSLSTGLQKRLASFLLKRAIGHLVKDGQLDLNQIEAGVTAGRLEIRDIELDAKAVNALLGPVPLLATSISLANISIQIPWSNLRGGDLVVLVQRPSAHFVVAPPHSAGAKPAQEPLDVSLADTVEDLLEEDAEGRELQESLQGSLHESIGVPGGAPTADDASSTAVEPEAGSIVASMVEGLLSRLKVEISDAHFVISEKVFLPEPTHFDLEANIRSIKLRTETSLEQKEDGSNWRRKVRNIDVTSLSLWTTLQVLLRHRSSLSSSDTSSDDSSTSPRSGSYESDDVMRMSQAVDDLALSVASGASRYEEAHSGTESIYGDSQEEQEPRRTNRTGSNEGRAAGSVHSSRSKILDFGDEPIVMQFITLRHLPAQPDVVASETSMPEVTGAKSTPTVMLTEQRREAQQINKLRKPEHMLDIAIGSVACFLEMPNVCALLALVEAIRLSSGLSVPVEEHGSSSPPAPPTFSSSNLRIASVELLCAYESVACLEADHAAAFAASVQSFWRRPGRSHPLLGHVRLHGEGIRLRQTQSNQTTEVNATVGDLRLTEGMRMGKVGELVIMPILVFDGELLNHSRCGAAQRLFDWRSGLDGERNPYLKGAANGDNAWKMKPLRGRTPLSPSRIDKGIDDTVTALLSLHGSLEKEEARLEVTLPCTHLFVDLSVALRAAPLLNAIASSSEAHTGLSTEEEQIDLEDSTNTLGANHLNTGRVVGNPSRHTKFSLYSDLVRLEVRIPNCKAAEPSLLRSGILAVDLAELSLSTAGPSLDQEPDVQRPRVRYAEGKPGAESGRPEKKLAQLSFRSLSIHFQCVRASEAETLAVLTHLTDDEDRPDQHPYFPSVKLSRQYNAAEGTGRLSARCNLPLLEVSLSKSTLDGIQFLADDFASWSAEMSHLRTNSQPEQDGLKILGSRFFRNSHSGLSSDVVESTATLQRVDGPVNQPIFILELSELKGKAFVPRLNHKGGDLRELTIAGRELRAHFDPLHDKNTTNLAISIVALTVSQSIGDDQILRPLIAPTLQQSLTRGVAPMISLTLLFYADAETSYRESRIEPLLRDFTVTLDEDSSLFGDIASFAKSPAGTFENVEPSELTRLQLNLIGASILLAPTTATERVAVLLGDLSVRSKLVGGAPRTSLHVTLNDSSAFLVDKPLDAASERRHRVKTPSDHWLSLGFVSVLDLSELKSTVTTSKLTLPDVDVRISRAKAQISACADTLTALISLISSFVEPPGGTDDLNGSTELRSDKGSTASASESSSQDIMAGIDENAFRVDAEGMTSIPDLLEDDIPSRPEYYGAERVIEPQDYEETPLTEEDFFGSESIASIVDPIPKESKTEAHSGFVILDSEVVTVRLLDENGLRPVPGYFSRPDLQPKKRSITDAFASSFRLRVDDLDLSMHLFAGYDWANTRTEIEAEIKRVRRRLQKIKQLLDEGQRADDSVEDAIQDLAESMHIAFESNTDAAAALNMLDDETGPQSETASSASTWQPLPRSQGRQITQGHSHQGRRRSKLERSHASLLEFVFKDISAEYDQMVPSASLASHLNVQVSDLQILDHIKSSSWHAFLTRMSEKGVKFKTGDEAKMVRIQLLNIKSASHEQGEFRVRAKLSPLRLHIDQDALEFLQKFFAFKRPSELLKAQTAPSPAEAASVSGPFIQYAEIHSIRLKADYKPKRVNYGLLRQGKAIELMNFFHFDGAETTLRHVTLRGITGWAKLFDTLNDIWTPDVKTYQIADVLAGIAPVRSLVNVGSGVADMILIPIEQVQKDGRLGLGLKKGAGRFAKVTALEVLKLGARLATGTQGLLEKAEQALGADSSGASGSGNGSASSQRKVAPTRRAYADEEADFDSGSEDDRPWSTPAGAAGTDGAVDSIPLIDDEEYGALISKFADQPSDVREALSQAYRSLRTGANAAAQTILAVPMEVYEAGSGGSGSGGGGGPGAAGRTVVKAVPIAVVQGAKGASEAVSRTLMGLRGVLEPGGGEDKEKYKRQSPATGQQVASSQQTSQRRK
ncbi:hypothetical protein BCV69DRAFT_312661 [Microstroma glucosiphilum]|uniref:Autophagy-related protein 2 n=1 Tax=Pseudomicrostroma glucosiphilum TaxID=1684307 RepID=A0A316U678_9BASI|nr:hypothetical protein BCV69DRAFT_312661 [Pseudomicrostroma glucosiphilum]PWN20710.1 hypothetical protein BCV69DRAFT_312661 [Pseudomicrostroma glucosiphilum]